jgi:iron complex outermembrane receptor protein
VNLSGGLAISPTDNFTVTVDAFHVKLKHRILLGATYSADDPVVAQIIADSNLTGVGGVQFTTNGLDTKTYGVDVTANLRVPAGSGTLDLNGSFNWTRNKITHVDGLPPILQGTATTYTGALDLITTTAITEERPAQRATLTGTWTKGRFHGLARALHYGSGKSAEFGGGVAEKFSAKTLMDAEVGYRFNQISISVGAKNIFDVYPSKMKDLDNNNNFTFPWAVASPFGYNGRYLYTRAEMVLDW